MKKTIILIGLKLVEIPILLFISYKYGSFVWPDLPLWFQLVGGFFGILGALVLIVVFGALGYGLYELNKKLVEAITVSRRRKPNDKTT